MDTGDGVQANYLCCHCCPSTQYPSYTQRIGQDTQFCLYSHQWQQPLAAYLQNAHPTVGVSIDGANMPRPTSFVACGSKTYQCLSDPMCMFPKTGYDAFISIIVLGRKECEPGFLEYNYLQGRYSGEIQRSSSKGAANLVRATYL